jgi:hypothetical protein
MSDLRLIAYYSRDLVLVRAWHLHRPRALVSVGVKGRQGRKSFSFEPFIAAMPFFPCNGAASVNSDRVDTNVDATMTSNGIVQAPPSSPPQSQIQAKNRRKRYLDLHPEYFKSETLELAGQACHSSFPSTDAIPVLVVPLA